MVKKKETMIKGEKIHFSYASTDSGIFLGAINTSPEIIAKCRFDVIRIFSRPLSREEKLKMVQAYKIPLRDLPKTKDFVIDCTNKELLKTSVQNNAFKTTLGNEFKLRDTFCRLYYIGVENQEYAKKGLATAMLKQVEEYALSQDCSRIETNFFPTDRKDEVSKVLYVRNGFKLITNDDKTQACIKELI